MEALHVFFPVPAGLSGIPSDQSSGTSSPLCDSGLHLNYHPNNTVLFSLAMHLTDWFCPYVTMPQHPRPQKVVSMQLSLLADNKEALSLSFEGSESALARLACLCTHDSSSNRLLTCQLFETCKVGNDKLFWIVFHTSAGHAVLLILAHVPWASLGEEMGGPAPYSTATLKAVAVHPRVWRLQVSCGT